jgi:hypothetical protein
MRVSNVIEEFNKLLAEEPVLLSVVATAAFKAALDSYGEADDLPQPLKEFMVRVADQLEILEPHVDKLDV